MSTDSTANPSVLFEGADEKPAKKPRAKKAVTELPDSGLPANLGKPLVVKVPDFSNPKRPKTCLEVDFPIVPINALSTLEGNAGKPIYQMSKWWARRRSCVFRALLLAAAIEAPYHHHADGSPVLDADGIPVPDETEAAKTVWDAYYANHQQAGNFKNLKVLDCFMGGGTTLVEGSRLGFQVAGNDLNPIAWFIVKNELSCPGPDDVKKLFAAIESEVKPQIQPFYVTEEVDGRSGVWREVATGEAASVDPAKLPPDKRGKYSYAGPEVVYTFWAKHGPCAKPGCNHRTPIFRSPVIATKAIGVKYLELTCKACKTNFHAELGSARMAPESERVILDNEFPFTELSQPFAKLLGSYNEGKKADKFGRVQTLLEMVEAEPGLRCPKCGEFSGQHMRDVLKAHRSRTSASMIAKKDFPVLPAGNGVKKVISTLLVHQDWLRGSPSIVEGKTLGGFVDASPEENAAWYRERLQSLRLIEVRGSESLAERAVVAEPAADDAPSGETSEVAESTLPRHITLADGSVLDTAYTTVPRDSHFTCGNCGLAQDVRYSVQATKRLAPVMAYALQCYSPQRGQDGYPYNGRFFRVPSPRDISRLIAAESEWQVDRDGKLTEYWPREEIPVTYMTHQANFALPEQGYTHWWKMFNSRQLLVHSLISKSIADAVVTDAVRDQALGAVQQYLRNQNMFCIWDKDYDKLAPFFSNSNYAPKVRPIENSVFGHLGRGNWTSTVEGVVEGTEWIASPWEVASAEIKTATGQSRIVLPDRVLPGAGLSCKSSTDLDHLGNESLDLVITDPPFGDNIFYSDLANFFYVWLRLPLKTRYPDQFLAAKTPHAQEATAPRNMPAEEANARYRSLLGGCWMEAHRVLKDGGLLAFTFHHSEDEQWAIVLLSLFDAGFILEQTFPIASDEMKGEGGQFGAKGTEYDIIHVCRKRLTEPKKVSWAKMRQWVRSELARLRRLLEMYRSRELSDADVRVILRGKALEFYSRHYGAVYTSEDLPLSIRDALLGINQLLDEDSDKTGDRPPSVVQPVVYQFLRLFGPKLSMNRNEVGMQLRGTGIVMREFEARGWVHEEDRTVKIVPIRERFDHARQRPRKEMKSELDQAHFLIGAAMPGSGVNIGQELSRDTWMLRRSVEAVLLWYAKIAVDPEVREAADLAAKLLKTSLEQNRAKLVHEQGFLFDDLDEDAA